MEITGVAGIAQSLSHTPASAYVISRDDIERSGAFLLPDMLRLAPNLDVAQTSPTAWTISARGLSGNAAAQNFPNKLLVMIDGRSVYSPLFSGVYWDMQDVPAENIDHIEVIDGPGGTLWGANAVNGIVNIITRNSTETAGGTIDLAAGDRFSAATLQYGGQAQDNLSYRFYVRDFYERGFPTPAGGNAHDGWSKPQGGFRLDWDGGKDRITLEGDIFGGAQAQPGAANQDISGANLTGHWNRDLGDGEALQLQAYYDRAERKTIDGGGLLLNTYDLEAQHNFALGSWNSIIWGFGNRVEQYRLTPRIGTANSLLWLPPARSLDLSNIFVQDQMTLLDGVILTAGLKVENDPYSGLSAMPSARLAWSFGSNLLWASVSRAVRSPTPFDSDVVEMLGTTVFLTGNPAFQPEQVLAYEAGYRGSAGDLTYSLSLFDDVYSDLRNIEATPTVFLPLFWGNGLKADIFGLRAWVSWQAADWWRISASLSLQHEDFRFAPGASTLLGTSQLGNDPRHSATLRSSMQIMDGVNLETDFRDVGNLPNPKVPEYLELNAQLNWRPAPGWQIALSGLNLLHGKHLEYDNGAQDLIPRSVMLETRWRF